MRMNLLRFLWTSVVLLPLLSVDQANSQQQYLSSGLMFLGILGGFFLGQMALSAFIVVLMAIVPPEEARSLTRMSRSIDTTTALKIDKASFNINNLTSAPGHFRNSRFISELLRSDPLNCMPQVMCELSSAKEPSTKTDTINDYKYLMKEMLESDDDAEDENVKEAPGFRTSSNIKKKSKHKNKKKDNDDSSPETDESLSKESEEQKSKIKIDPIQDKAEFMELELEDALEEKAWKDLINEDPGDIGYALADMKRKEKIQEMVNQGAFDQKESEEDFGYLSGNALNYKRNLDILESSLEQNKNHGIFRTSRAFQESFILGKQHELSRTKDVYDRVRIAAEVVNITRSARKCRALFNECPLGGSGINKVVNNLRKVIVGTPATQGKKKSQNRSKSDLNVNDLQAIVNQLQPAGGTNVKVTLNIGNDPRMGLGPMMSYPYYTYPANSYTVTNPINSTVSENASPSIMPGILIQNVQNVSSTTAVNPESAEMSTEPIHFMPESNEVHNIFSEDEVTNPTLDDFTEVIQSSAEVVTNSSELNKPEESLQIPPQKGRIKQITRDEEDVGTDDTNVYSLSFSTTQMPSKSEYKNVLREASHLIKDLKASSVKNAIQQPTSASVKPNPIFKKVHEQIEALILKIDPKGKINVRSDDSNSDESGESSEELINPLLPILPTPAYKPASFNEKRKRMTPKVQVPSPQGYSQSQEQKTSWIGSVYDIFFKDKQTMPLPSKTDEWVPSAHRHALRSGIPPSRYPDVVNNYGMFGVPYANSYYPPRHGMSFGNPNQLGGRELNFGKSKTENLPALNRNKFKKSSKSRTRNEKLATTTKPRRVMKYKSCCSKSTVKHRSG